MSESKKFAVFDIDGTLIRWQLYHAIADALIRLGFAEASAYDPVKAARMAWKRRETGASFSSYEAELIRVYGEILKTIKTTQLEQAAAAVFDEYKDQVYTYTRNLIKDLKNDGYLIFAISGSQAEVVKLMAEHYGFDDYLGTDFERSGERFTGQRTFHAGDKAAALKKLTVKHSVTFSGSVAVGDSKGDAAMLEMVERPITFNPDQDLYRIAREKGWGIVLERKNMVYELESINGKYQLAKTNLG